MSEESGVALESATEDDIDDQPMLKPEEPSLPPGEWVQKNLFSSVFNSVLTILTIVVMAFAVRGLLNYIFSEERVWSAPATNARLILTFAYPESQYARVWVTVGLLAVLAGTSIGLWAQWAGVSAKKLCFWSMNLGSGILLAIVLTQPGVHRDAAGEVLRDADSAVLRKSFATAMSDRLVWWIVGLAFIGAGLLAWNWLGEMRRRTIRVPSSALIFGSLGLIILSLWIVNYGHYAFSDGEFIAISGRTVASTTKQPWTVMWLILVGSFFLGRRISQSQRAVSVKGLMNLAWLLSPFIIYWVILRDPSIDYSHVWTTDLPIFLAFAIGGGAILWLLSYPGIGEAGRLAGVGLVVVAIFQFAAAFTGWYPMLQKARISFVVLALVGLAASNFSGERSQRVRFVGVWVVLMALLHYFATVMNSPATVDVVSENFTGGLTVTLFVTALTLMISFPLGVVLALGRTSSLPIFRIMSTAYIESIRGVPLITILFFFSNILPLFLPDGMDIAEFAAIILGYSLFSAAYLAENVRGGLQAIRRGQYEAADALGLTSPQRTSFIVLPQALRISIPPLVGQVIGTFKETSLIAIIGGFDLLRIGNQVIPAQTQFLGIKRENLLIVAAMYWLITFAISKYSMRLERRLGVGER